ncbi:ABC transporter ATP-binding protein [Bombiscardovia apis]|uniref:ABC transporter ATP-binding protein n=1 Tax=Bombiscardovia apis TaxID=2932182 RepID=A0ABM8BE80_9BIFI|nr:ATP-binding cassette domain-containing protein [Bombiscardovia apis]BDR55239.1 ABC transporter ATP-binding protein [Bombiscardovia apis]
MSSDKSAISKDNESEVEPVEAQAEKERTESSDATTTDKASQGEPKPATDEDTANKVSTAEEADGSEEREAKTGPEFKVVIEAESAVVEGEAEAEEERITILEPSAEEAEVLVPSGYPVLELRHVSLKEAGKNASGYLLDDVNFDFRLRRTHCLQAGSFERLSALMALMSGFMAPSEGSVLFRGTDIRQLEAWDYRGHQLGVLFAHDALRTDLSAIENITYTMDASGRTFLKAKDVIARELLEEMNFPQRLEQRPVRELSRVDYVRAAIARAVCCECDVLLAQEIMDGLSEEERGTVFALLTKTAKRHDCAVIVACIEATGEGPYDETYSLD